MRVNTLHRQATAGERPAPWKCSIGALALLGLALAAPGTASAIAIGADGYETTIGSSGETALLGDGGILAQIASGITLRRVDDSLDQLWQLAAGAEAIAHARFAGYDNSFGLLAGATGGNFIQIFDSLSGGIHRSEPVSLEGRDIPLGGDFRPAIQTPHGAVYSALQSDNPNGSDHMVTWVNTDDAQHYFVAFEDLPIPGADGDYNDVVIELKNVIDGPVPAPEPSILSLVGLSLLAMGAVQRRRRR